MVPPVTHENLANTEAALSKWNTLGAFDSASDCEGEVADLKASLWTKGDKSEIKRLSRDFFWRTGHLPLSYSEYAKRMDSSECIESDDPRLGEMKT